MIENTIKILLLTNEIAAVNTNIKWMTHIVPVFNMNLLTGNFNIYTIRALNRV